MCVCVKAQCRQAGTQAGTEAGKGRYTQAGRQAGSDMYACMHACLFVFITDTHCIICLFIHSLVAMLIFSLVYT